MNRLLLWGKKQQKSREDLHSYWSNPDAINDPSTYKEGEARSIFLQSLVRNKENINASILELGCNVGRNLHHLWQAGFHNLSGVEINPKALELMKQYFPEMQVKTYQGTIEDNIKQLSSFDLIFTMAVLEHIHHDSEWVFAEITKRANHLITIEDEKNTSERHFPRNYRKIFEGLGMKQVYEKQLSEQEGLGKKFYARVFTK